MTNHPTPPPLAATPSVLDRFRDAAEQVLTEAKNTIAKRDQLKTENAYDIAADRDDERDEQQAVQALQEIQARRSKRRAVMAERQQAIAALDAEAKRLEADGQKAVAYIEQWEQAGQVTQTVTDGVPGRPIGAIESCPGCRQPIAWDGLRWTHATVTDCTADLTAVSPQQDGGRS
jgi:hypothetical protein